MWFSRGTDLDSAKQGVVITVTHRMDVRAHLLVAAAGQRTLPQSARRQKPATNPSGAATKAFLDRLQEYVRYHNNVEKMVPPLTGTANPAKISDREKALGRRADQAAARRQAGRLPDQGIPADPHADHQGRLRTPAARRSQGVNPGVTQRASRSTSTRSIRRRSRWRRFPSNLLQKLPALPESWNIRIVGRDLILRDVTGNVVVDVMREVFPITMIASRSMMARMRRIP